MKSFVKILIALMLGFSVIFATVACESTSADNDVEEEEDEEEEDEKKDKKKSDEDEEESEEDEEQASEEDSEDSAYDKVSKKSDENEDEVEVEAEEEKPSKEEKKPSKKSDDDYAEEAEEALDAALSCMIDLDLEGVAEYMTDGGDFENSGITSSDDFVEAMLESSGMEDQFVEVFGEDGSKDVIDAISTLIDDMLDTLDYDIIECTEISEDEATFEVELTAPDFDSIDFAFDDEMGEQIAMDAVDEGIIYEGMSEEEMIGALIPYMMEVMVEMLEDEIENVDTLTETVEITLVNENGEWLINEELETPAIDFFG